MKQPLVPIRRISVRDTSSQQLPQPQHRRCDCILRPAQQVGHPIPSLLPYAVQHSWVPAPPAAKAHTEASRQPPPSILPHIRVLPGSPARSQLCQDTLLSSCQPHRLTLASTLHSFNPHTLMSITTDGAVNPGCSHALHGLSALPSLIFPVQRVSECQVFSTPVSHTVQ